MSDAPTQVRNYESKDKPELLEILQRVYDPEVRRKHEFLWDWWQKWNCVAGDENHRPTVILRKGRLAGYSGAQPRRFKVGSREAVGIFTQDTFTDPGDRGVGILLVRHIIKSTEILIGAPVSRSNTLWKKVFGKENIEIFFIRKGKRVIDPYVFIPTRAKAIFGFPVRLFWRLAQAAIEGSAGRLKGAKVEPIGRFPVAVNPLCERWAASRTIAALRDADYLNWRYADSPMSYEKRLLWQGKELVGLAAFRLGVMNGRKVLLLVELLVHHARMREAYTSLLVEVLAFARRNGVSDVQTFDSGCDSMREAMKRLGFLFSSEKMPLLGKWLDDKSDDCPIYRTGDWFISAGDSDYEFSYFNQGWESLEASRA